PANSINAMLATVWARYVLTFFGHGVWTGLVCAAIWRGKGAGGPRFDLQVLGAYLVSVVLHGLWDWSTVLCVIPVAVVGMILLRHRIKRATEAEYQSLRALGLAPSSSVAAGTVLCPSCGALVPAGAMYCLRCGTPLAATARTQPQ